MDHWSDRVSVFHSFFAVGLVSVFTGSFLRLRCALDLSRYVPGFSDLSFTFGSTRTLWITCTLSLPRSGFSGSQFRFGCTHAVCAFFSLRTGSRVLSARGSHSFSFSRLVHGLVARTVSFISACLICCIRSRIISIKTNIARRASRTRFAASRSRAHSRIFYASVRPLFYFHRGSSSFISGSWFLSFRFHVLHLTWILLILLHFSFVVLLSFFLWIFAHGLSFSRGSYGLDARIAVSLDHGLRARSLDLSFSFTRFRCGRISARFTFAFTHLVYDHTRTPRIRFHVRSRSLCTPHALYLVHLSALPSPTARIHSFVCALSLSFSPGCTHSLDLFSFRMDRFALFSCSLDLDGSQSS